MVNKIKKVVFLVIAVISTVTKGAVFGEVAGPAIFLTFDDRSIARWEKYLPLFAKYDARVTFFIDRFDLLSDEQIKALHRIKAAGHTIGCHGLRHVRAVDYYKEHSVEKYIADEIRPALKAMEANGFSPTCFAYPYSNCDSITDRALRPYFRHVRSGKALSDNQTFVKTTELKDRFRLTGFSFHPKTKDEILMVQAKQAIDRIVANGEVLVLYAHDIRNPDESGPAHFIIPEALEEIMVYATNKKVKIYGFDELP